MSYIKAVVPMNDYQLFMEMESGSSVTVNSWLGHEIRGVGG